MGICISGNTKQHQVQDFLFLKELYGWKNIVVAMEGVYTNDLNMECFSAVVTGHLN
jgi:hypothetical protein